MEWYNFRKSRGKSVQKRHTLLAEYLKSNACLLKCIGGLHSYLHHTNLFFKPKDMDEVCVQAQYLEEHGRYDREDYQSKTKGKDKVATSSTKEENKKKKGHCSYCGKDGNVKEGCWRLYPEQAPRWFDQRRDKENTNAIVSKEPKKFHEIEDSSIIDGKLACVGLKLLSVVNTKGVVMHM